MMIKSRRQMYKNICFDGVFQKLFHYTVRWKDIYNCNFLSNCKIVYCYRLHSYNSAVSLYHDNSVHFMFNVYLSETLWFFMTDNCSLTHKQNQFSRLNVEKHIVQLFILSRPNYLQKQNSSFSKSALINLPVLHW